MEITTATLPDPTPIDLVRDRLLAQAYLFDDASAYAAGVEDALDALATPRSVVAAGA